MLYWVASINWICLTAPHFPAPLVPLGSPWAPWCWSIGTHGDIKLSPGLWWHSGINLSVYCFMTGVNSVCIGLMICYIIIKINWNDKILRGLTWYPTLPRVTEKNTFVSYNRSGGWFPLHDEDESHSTTFNMSMITLAGHLQREDANLEFKVIINNFEL